MPPYYWLKRLVVARPGSVGVRLYGLLFSPSRGFFTFSPFFLLVLGGAVWFLRPVKRHSLFLFSLTWFVLQLVIVARATRWWGGWSYGPRLLTEVIPAFVLLTILLWRELSPRLTARRRYALVAAYLLLGAAGIFINSAQGLYNEETQRWNGALAPNVDFFPEYLLSWRYPQFLASPDSLCRRHWAFVNDELRQNHIQLAPYGPGEVITHDAPDAKAFFVGWGQPGGVVRWSVCPSSAVLFPLPALDSGRSYLLSVTVASTGDQVVRMVLNGVPVGTGALAGRPAAPATYSLPIAGEWLKPDEVNELAFHMANATTTAVQDGGEPRIAFVSLGINSQGEPP